MSDDNVSGPYPIGIEFSFYDSTYTEFYVSSNGFIGFDPNMDNGCCSGQPLPDDDYINNIIAWAWRDGYPFGDTYYENFDDKTIIQFDEYGLCCTESDGSATVEIILYSNGQIKINYLELSGFYTDGYQSIGIENSSANIGLEYTWNNEYLESASILNNESAILITTNTPEYLYPPMMVIHSFGDYHYQLSDESYIMILI